MKDKVDSLIADETFKWIIGHIFIGESLFPTFQTKPKKVDNINMGSSTKASNLIYKIFFIFLDSISIFTATEQPLVLLYIRHHNFLLPVKLWRSRPFSSRPRTCIFQEPEDSNFQGRLGYFSHSFLSSLVFFVTTYGDSN